MGGGLQFRSGGLGQWLYIPKTCCVFFRNCLACVVVFVCTCAVSSLVLSFLFSGFYVRLLQCVEFPLTHSRVVVEGVAVGGVEGGVVEGGAGAREGATAEVMEGVGREEGLCFGSITRGRLSSNTC